MSEKVYNKSRRMIVENNHILKTFEQKGWPLLINYLLYHETYNNNNNNKT